MLRNQVHEWMAFSINYMAIFEFLSFYYVFLYLQYVFNCWTSFIKFSESNLERNRKLPKMQPKGDRFISYKLWLKLYWVASKSMAIWNSQTTPSMHILNTKSLVSFSRRLSISTISNPLGPHSSMMRFAALSTSSIDLKTAFPLIKSEIQHLVGIFFSHRSCRIVVIS